MTRREWLIEAAAMLTAAGCRTGCGHPRIRLAFQVYGVRDACEKDLIGTLTALRSAGYEGVEAGRWFGRTPTETIRIWRDVGLAPASIQIPKDLLEGAAFEERLDFAQAAGTKNIFLAFFDSPSADDWIRLADQLSAAAARAEKRGLRFGFHPHAQEFRLRFGGKTAWEFLYDRVSPLVRQELDIGHCRNAGEDPVAWLNRYPHRNPCLHATPSPDTLGWIGAPGDRIDWTAVLAVASRQGTEWIVVKPTEHPDSIDDAVKSGRYLKALGT